MKPTTLLIAALFAPLGGARAQTTFTESEPNETKATADLAQCLTDGDLLRGTTTGSSTSVAGAASADTFRTRTCDLPTGIYRHRLVLTTAGPAGHVGSLRGLTQSTHVILAGTDVEFQHSLSTGLPARMCQWYGFGQSEELYYRVTGTSATTASYTATFGTRPVSPRIVPGSFAPGTITIDSTPAGSTDTDFWLYSASLAPIAGAGNDDPLGSPTAGVPAKLVRSLGPGSYTVAMSTWNSATNLPSASDDAAPNENVLDFPGVFASNSSTSTGQPLNFTISDGVTTQLVSATMAGSFEVLFATFTVGGTPAFEAFCSGDAAALDHTTHCPCGNNGLAGRGCGHSFDPGGARLAATGSPAADTVQLQSSFEPATAFTLFLQHDAPADAVFHDGVLCAGGTLVRLRGRSAVAGAATFPNPTWDSSITLSQRGGVALGSGVRRFYSAWYRNASTTFCPPATANVTNGWRIDW